MSPTDQERRSMFETYRIMVINDSNLDYKVKYRYMVMKFCGADSQQRPIYRLCRQEKTEAKAQQYIAKHQA